MKTELDRLSACINAAGELENFQIDSAACEGSRNQFRLTLTDFQERLEQRIGEQESLEKLTVFIHHVQVNLTRYAGHVYQYYQASGELVDMKELYMDIYQEIIRVFEYLKVYYFYHFDQLAMLPEGFISLKRNNLVEKSENILAALRAKKIEAKLIDILGCYLSCTEHSGELRPNTWRQYDYLIALSSQMESFAGREPGQDDTLELIILLTAHNFNAIVFYNYMLDYMQSAADDELPYEEQEMTMIEFLKTMQNIRCEWKEGYNSQVQFIGDSLCDCISKGIIRIVRLKEVYQQENAQSCGWSGFCFKVDCTIEVLLFFFRILQDIGFVTTRFKASVHAFVKKHFTTVRTKDPSLKYMRNISGKSRDVPPRTVKALRAWLMKIINYIDTHYQEQLKV